jgi:hypothetical protein
MTVDLSPYQSIIAVFGEDLPTHNYTEVKYSSTETLDLKWDIDVYETGTGVLDGKFKPYRKKAGMTIKPGNVGSPDFSGLIRYRAEFSLQTAGGSLALDFNAPGQTVKMKLNGKDCGMRICPPYQYDVTGIIRSGANTLELETANTMVHGVKDALSFYIQIPPSGLQDPVLLLGGKGQSIGTIYYFNLRLLNMERTNIDQFCLGGNCGQPRAAGSL